MALRFSFNLFILHRLQNKLTAYINHARCLRLPTYVKGSSDYNAFVQNEGIILAISFSDGTPSYFMTGSMPRELGWVRVPLTEVKGQGNDTSVQNNTARVFESSTTLSLIFPKHTIEICQISSRFQYEY